MKKAVSAGGIVVKGSCLVFVRFPSNKLTFPKGTVENGETLEQTALREVQEETGLSGLKIIRKLGSVTRPAATRAGLEVMKDIYLYLMTVNDYHQDEAEEKTEWLTISEALPEMYLEEAEFLKKIAKEIIKS